jgi:hypothetical protein
MRGWLKEAIDCAVQGVTISPPPRVVDPEEEIHRIVKEVTPTAWKRASGE